MSHLRVGHVIVIKVMLCALSQAPAVAAISVEVSITGQSLDGRPMVGRQLSARLNIGSTFDVVSVALQAEGISREYQGNPTSVMLDIERLDRGVKTLIVTVRDVFGETATAKREFFHDDPPTITIESPTSEEVVREAFRVRARCSDDDATIPCTIGVYAPERPSPPLASGAGVVEYVMPLSGIEDRVDFSLTAVDSVGAQSVVQRSVWVEDSPSLEVVARAAGQVLDFDNERLLVWEPTSGVLSLSSRGDGVASKIGEAPSLGRVALNASGAAWLVPHGQAGCFELWQRLGGETVKITTKCDSQGLRLAGAFASWNEYVSAADAGLFSRTRTVVRHLASGAESRGPLWLIYEKGGTGGIVHGFFLAPNGDVFAFGEDATRDDLPIHVLRLRGHEIETLASMTGYKGPGAISAVADGQLLAFWGGGGAEPGALPDWLSVLQPGKSVERIPAERTDLWANSGWVGFMQTTTGIRQLFVRSPAGEISRLTYFNVTPRMEALGGDGEAVVSVSFAAFGAGSAQPSGRYLVAPGKSPVLLTTRKFGTFEWRCEGWYLRLGGALLRVTVPHQLPKSCAADTSNAPDAGVSADASAGSPDSATRDLGPANRQDTASVWDAGAQDAAIDSLAGGTADAVMASGWKTRAAADAP